MLRREPAILGSGRMVAWALALIALCWVLFFYRLGSRPLWDQDEGMHAVTSRAIVTSGDWITPTFNGEPFFDKPIFFNWLVALSFSIGGFSELAARLPGALSGACTVVLTILLGSYLFGARRGFLAGVVLATSLLMLVCSRTVVHDMALTLFVSLSLALSYLAIRTEEHRRRNALLAWVAVGLGVLTKGPIALVLLVMVIGGFLGVTRRWHLVRRLEIGWGLLIVTAIAALWYVPVSLRHEGYLAYFVVEQNLARFFSPSARHSSSFFHYVPVLVGGMFPWSFLLPLAMLQVLRSRRGEAGGANVFLLVWFGSMFLFFSIASSKLPTYLLPALPAAALLVAGPVEDLWSGPNQRTVRALRWLFLPAFLVALVAAIFLWSIPISLWETKYGIESSHLIWFTGVGIVGMLLGWSLLGLRRYRAFIVSIVGLVVAEFLVFSLILAPVVDAHRSTRDIAMEVHRRLGQEEDLVFYSRIKDSALFYTARHGSILRLPEDLAAYFDSTDRRYCLIDLRYLSRVQSLSAGLYFIGREGTTYLVSNRPDADPSLATRRGLTAVDPEVAWTLAEEHATGRGRPR